MPERSSQSLQSNLLDQVRMQFRGQIPLVIRFSPSYSDSHKTCVAEASTQRIQESLRRVTGQAIAVRFEIDRNANARPAPQVNTNGQHATPAPAPTERKRSLGSLPMFKKAIELGAQIWHVDDDFNPTAPPKSATRTDDETDTEE